MNRKSEQDHGTMEQQHALAWYCHICGRITAIIGGEYIVIREGDKRATHHGTSGGVGGKMTVDQNVP